MLFWNPNNLFQMYFYLLHFALCISKTKFILMLHLWHLWLSNTWTILGTSSRSLWQAYPSKIPATHGETDCLHYIYMSHKRLNPKQIWANKAYCFWETWAIRGWAKAKLEPTMADQMHSCKHNFTAIKGWSKTHKLLAIIYSVLSVWRSHEGWARKTWANSGWYMFGDSSFMHTGQYPFFEGSSSSGSCSVDLHPCKLCLSKQGTCHPHLLCPSW